jgi:putative PIN family toxin of toxin-antitoxin system
VPIVNQATVQELIRVLAYPKFKLSQEEIETSLNAYLPYTEMVAAPLEDMSDLPSCRDEDDQMFVSLAAASKADVLISGDQAILELAGQTPFAIETPAQFKKRFLPED